MEPLPSVDGEPAKGMRSSTGCLTCRDRRVKCKEERPVCSHCARLSLACQWRGKHVPLKDRKEQKAKKRPPKPLMPKATAGMNAFVVAQAHLQLSSGVGKSLSDVEQGLFGYARGDGNVAASSFSFLDEGVMSPFSPLTWACPSPMMDMELASTGLLTNLPSLVTLTEAEHQALDYYQKETGFGFGSKTPAWSTHAILMRTASKSGAVLHLLLAATITEIGWREGGSIFGNAEGHYKLGRQLLNETMASPQSDPVEVMASFWFLYLVQRRRPAREQMSYKELSNLMCDYIRNHQLHDILSLAESEGDETHLVAVNQACSPDRRALLARLAVWLFWIDAQSCFQGEGGRMARLLAATPRGIHSLYEVSRDALQLHWASQYPDDELIDDLKNASALELLHHTWAMVQEINEEVESPPLDPERSRDIKKRLEALRRRYPISSVFRLSESTSRVRDRLMANSDWAVANYYALCIYHFRCSLTEDQGFFGGSDHIDEIAAVLLVLIQRSLSTDDIGQLDRLQWPLFWAGIETADQFKQTWILEKMSNQGLRDALEMILLEQSDGVRTNMGRVRRICQTTVGAQRLRLVLGRLEYA
ncbi:hypothetical protein B0T25DRAFT_532999 [Lasiosphaeria hispida]|uniref:Zn(2)-C6 fungal-type domain-containing protein n=1 Tax=Lasiosphaeria hispida TaxID=260671 RepID=A0AAJ0MHX8_9PEZI|nr:hypothetical protein B0T25DRAFT_532999 [Lasiosphaeria hispida]